MLHSLKNCGVHMCEQCVAKTKMYVLPGQPEEVLPGYFLVRATQDGHEMKANEWGLVRCNDPDFIFAVTPEPFAFWGMSDEELDKLPDHEQDSISEWETLSATFGKQTLASILERQYREYFETIDQLRLACVAKGWKAEDSSMERWLFHYLGTYLLTAVEFVEAEK